jgi:acetyl coenzyme A synthetase (ADP forming)-like protein
MNTNLAKLFAPKSIAIYGVSRDTSKIGSTIFANLLSSGYMGKLFPINPKYSELYGHTCYPKIKNVPHRVDLAIMAIPAEFAPEVVKDCAAKGVKNLVIISAGFSEVGEVGKELELKLGKLAEKHELNILGPNCLGLIVPEANMNASFAPANVAPGDVAFMSQSGAVCTAMLDVANHLNFGFSHFVSIGNKLNVNENDFLSYWLNSEKVRVIGAYLEEFADGYDFISTKERKGIEKPVVVIHPGKSAEARAAISSHTGSLAGSDELIDAALEKKGITRVNTISEAFSAMMAFSWGKLPKGKRVGLVTNAGGPGIIATDILVANGLEMPKLSEELSAQLAAVLPATAGLHNPIDVLGDANAERYRLAIELLEASDEVDIVIVLLTPQLVTQIEDTAKLLINLYKHSTKTILPVFLGGRYVNAGVQRLVDNRIPAVTDLEIAGFVLNKMYKYAQYLKQRHKVLQLSELKQAHKRELHAGAELKTLPETAVQQLLNDFGFTLPRSAVVRNLEEALAAAKEIQYPLVLKATTEDIVHKTDFKALYVGIENDTALAKALTDLQGNIYKHTGRDYPPVLMQQMVKAEEELFIGAKRDGAADVYSKNGRGFGHLLLFGKGGIYTEVYQDISRVLLPASVKQLESVVTSTKVYKVIAGARGKKPLAQKALLDTIHKLQSLLLTYPEIAEVDFNPVMLTHKHSYVVDAKLFVKA